MFEYVVCSLRKNVVYFTEIKSFVIPATYDYYIV